MAGEGTIRIFAPAKVNLTLHILGKRADGYHDIESLTAFAQFGDGLEVCASDKLQLSVEGEFAAAAGGGDANLVLRAARLMQAKTDCTRGAAIRLEKYIPVGAGLGGGSANAAAVLHALNRLWALDVPLDTLLSWAPELGADVAMCLAARPTIARGIGEVLTPLPNALPEIHAVLVHPRTPLLTSDVYRALVMKDGAQPMLLTSPALQDFAQCITYLTHCRNDLQEAAMQVSPDVGRVLQALAKTIPRAPLVRMTGSGACCFALYATAQEAADAAVQLQTRHSGWWVKATALGRA